MRKVFAVLCALGCIGAFMTTLAGCATVRPRPGRDLLSFTGSGAMAYIVLPVQANRSLAARVIAGINGGMIPDSALDRLDTVYAALYAEGGMRAAISGRMPKAAASLLFNPSAGWVSHDDSRYGRWYTQENKGGAIPEKNLAFVSGGSARIEDMLEAWKRPVSVVTSPSFDSWMDSPERKTSIGLYLTDFAPVAERILGPEVDLPVDHAEVFIAAGPKNEEGGLYGVSAHIVMRDARATRAMIAILRLGGLTGSGQLEIRGDGPDVYVSGYEMPEEKLAGLAEFLYLSK